MQAGVDEDFRTELQERRERLRSLIDNPNEDLVVGESNPLGLRVGVPPSSAASVDAPGPVFVNPRQYRRILIRRRIRARQALARGSHPTPKVSVLHHGA